MLTQSLTSDLAVALVCPVSKQRLFLSSIQEAEAALRCRLAPLRAAPRRSHEIPVGRTTDVFMREDGACAFPVVDGIPILLAPEMLGPEGTSRDFDLADRKFAEAYEEMAHYNEVAEAEARAVEQSKSFRILEPTLRAPRSDPSGFPLPREVWLDATYESAAQWDAYAHIAPLEGKRTLQIGGKGIHAVKFLLAGALEAWLLTPMVGECKIAIALARMAGVEERLRCIVGIAEEIPVASEYFDSVFSGGCVHHMVTHIAFPEIARILKRGGKFAALDPWRAPLYGIGTKIFGKREPNVFCKPLTKDRVAPLHTTFSQASLIHHGALTRYPFLALKKMGLPVPLDMMWKITRVDDALCNLVGLRRFGSSVALIGEK